MSVNKALDSILENRLDSMRTHFSNALATKAVEKLEERKIEIAQNYFGQMQEEAEQLDELDRDGILKRYSHKVAAKVAGGEESPGYRIKGAALAGRKRWGGTGGIPAAKVPGTRKK